MIILASHNLFFVEFLIFYKIDFLMIAERHAEMDGRERFADRRSTKRR